MKNNLFAAYPSLQRADGYVSSSVPQPLPDFLRDDHHTDRLLKMAQTVKGNLRGVSSFF